MEVELDQSHYGGAAEKLLARVAGLEAENARLREDAAGAAALRQAFYQATEQYPEAHKRGDGALMAVWGGLYDAVRDSGAGLGVVQRVAGLEARVRELEGKGT